MGLGSLLDRSFVHDVRDLCVRSGWLLKLVV